MRNRRNTPHTTQINVETGYDNYDREYFNPLPMIVIAGAILFIAQAIKADDQARRAPASKDVVEQCRTVTATTADKELVNFCLRKGS